MMIEQNECSEILELLPDYAFGLADEETIRRVEAALSHCPEAVRQLLEYRALQADMRGSVPQVNPPPRLRSRLRKIVSPAGTASVPAAERAPKVPNAALDPSMTIRQTPLGVGITPNLSRRRTDGMSRLTRTETRQFRPAAWAYIGLIAVIAIVVTALIGTNLHWISRLEEATRQRDAFQVQLVEYRTRWFMVEDTNTVEMVSMTADDSPMAGMLLWSIESPMCMVALHDFPMLTPGRTYQVWLLRDGIQPISAGMLSVDEGGFGVLTFHSSEAITTYDAIGITEEPSGGSSAPSMPPLVLGSM